MQTRVRCRLAQGISALGILGCVLSILAFGGGEARALTFHDPVHAAQTKLSKVELIKQLEEMKKSYAELQKQTQYLQNTFAKLGDLTGGNLSPDALMARLLAAARCALPELSLLKLPDGYSANFYSLCDAAKSVRELVLPNENGETHDGVELSLPEHLTAVRNRRKGIHEDASVKSLAASLTALESHTDVARSPDNLIAESNAAITVDDLLRVLVKGQATMIANQARGLNLQAEMLRLMAAKEIMSLRTTVTTRSEIEGENN